jgi:prepilin-type N-terminal cleavage/methylation domain-containing protein
MTPSLFARRSIARRPRGFTMIELLVVIGIIVLLAAILVPVVNQVRMRGYVAVTQGQMQRLMTACQNYYHDWNSYPGPLANNQVQGSPASPPQPVNMMPNPNVTLPQGQQTLSPAQVALITSSENLVLGLLGLLSPGNSAADVNSYYAPPPPQHDVMSLNYNRPGSYHYIDYIPEELTDGLMFGMDIRKVPQAQPPTDWGIMPSPPAQPNTPGPQPEKINDSIIPEFQDHIPSPMPILYLKAYTGVQVGQPPSAINGLVTNDESKALAQYDFSQLAPYGFLRVKSINSGGQQISDYPFPANLTPPTAGGVTNDVVAYFMNPNIAGQPRGRDSFILISAGADRIYGTADDIIVAP